MLSSSIKIKKSWYLYWVKNCFAVLFYIIFNRWSKNPLSWDDREKMGLAQYHLVKWSHGNSLGTSRRTGNPLNMSSVFLEFTFQRRQGFYILQVHTPFKRFTNKKNILLVILFPFLSRKSLLLVALKAWHICNWHFRFMFHWHWLFSARG